VDQLPSRLIVGWQEWVALPDLGLPALKAKIDTGAKTSALHTHSLEPYGSSRHPMVRFSVRPNPEARDLEVEASARVIDRREVISSNGVRELRFVIRSRLSIGGRSWPIEITLTNRDRMTYRMLIGRQAIRSDMLVDAAASFRQPRLSYRVYAGGKSQAS
jgi:ribosomal protein S6--L-glutamate ligase